MRRRRQDLPNGSQRGSGPCRCHRDVPCRRPHGRGGAVGQRKVDDAQAAGGGGSAPSRHRRGGRHIRGAGPGGAASAPPTPRRRLRVLEAVREVVAAGVTVVVATHDPALRRRADEVVGLEHGRRVAARAGRPGVGGAAGSPFARPGAASPLLAPPATTPEPDPDPLGPEEPLVEVVDVVKSYRRGDEVVHAVDGVRLFLPAGRLVGLVGRSGSGKTTLLNVIGGWEGPDRGEGIWSRGGPVGDRPTWSDVAILPQRFGLLDELSVRANVEYPGRLAGRLDHERVDDLLDRLGLTELQDRQPRETSVGEQQRAALARALVLSPRLLLADEPTRHQDTGWARAVLEALRRAAAEGTCCLVATHDQEVARGFDRVVAMADGRANAVVEPS